MNYSEKKTMPAPFKTHKKIGAMQLYLTPAFKKDEYYLDEGCVRIELAKYLAPKKYDWNNKLVFKFTAKEIASLIFALKNLKKDPELSLVHDPSKANPTLANGKKTFWIKAGTNNTCFFNIKYNNNILKTVLDKEEIYIVVLLLEKAITKIYGW
jgi:hypothetical protein